MTTKNEYVVYNLIGFSIVGIIIKLFFKNSITEDGSSGPANASIWGYGVVLLSVFAGMFISFSLASNITNLNKNFFLFLKELLLDSFPSLVTLAVLAWIVMLNVTYFKRINQGKTSNEYTQLSNISTILMIAQIIVLFLFLRDQTNANKDTKMSYIVYVITIVNVVILGMMNIILRFFSTDG